MSNRRLFSDLPGPIVGHGSGLIVTWNQSATFNVWRFTGESDNHGQANRQWVEEVDVFTVYGLSRLDALERGHEYVSRHDEGADT